MRTVAVIIVAIAIALAFTAPLYARDGDLESRVDRLERKVKDTNTGLIVWLFAAFCALWAQNTRRSAWLWFFLGLFFNVITVLVLLYKNAEDRTRAAAPATPS